MEGHGRSRGAMEDGMESVAHLIDGIGAVAIVDPRNGVGVADHVVLTAGIVEAPNTNS